jgi:hypothetical protein
MKKITLIAVALVAVSFASCKKEKTCSCTQTVVNTNSSYNNNSTYSYDVKYGKIKKSDANLVCPTTNVSTSDNGQTGSFNNVQTKTTSCTLK